MNDYPNELETSAPAAQVSHELAKLEHGWWWFVLLGILLLLLGVVIYRHFPASALWLIGTIVGIEMILNGWTWIMLAYSIKSISADVE